jgi:hypothetical protein
MNSLKLPFLFLCLFLTVGTVVADNDGYHKATIAIDPAPGHKSYRLTAGNITYEINHCGNFQSGQEVEFSRKSDRIYIAHEGARDYHCSILSITKPTADSGRLYSKGTILGYTVRRDYYGDEFGRNGAGDLFGADVRKAKVYELQGPTLIYQVDYCGAFQAGQFSPGQVAEFRVDDDSDVERLYIRHDGDKEYSCQLEGARKLDAPAK